MVDELDYETILAEKKARLVSLYCQCTNVECATTYKIHVATVHTIAPSLTPNPTVYLPVGKVDRLPTDPRQLPLIDA
ncbi:transcriptional regulator [Burkholderia cepacia]|uniref:Transcriptional regulator n=1 Tax=Burkholderia cepacia TaxID=292 RepID=A0A2S8I0Q2_BURCE|nr:transcriptional regulator [Burkholderia cepacia]